MVVGQIILQHECNFTPPWINLTSFSAKRQCECFKKKKPLHKDNMYKIFVICCEIDKKAEISRVAKSSSERLNTAERSRKSTFDELSGWMK